MLRVLGACSLVLSVGCRGASTPIVDPKEGPTSAPPPPTATASPPPKPAPSTVASTYPAHTDACTTDADCGSTNYGLDCCFRCETAVGDHAWVAKVDAYCKAAEKAGTVKGCSPTICGGAPPPKPGQLGYINAIPRCAAGHCKK
ncbi:MAG: hypothetical protein IPJ34_13705 [Myxococcales bacterium]|nr:hypothetical protein [Myxococcales bacterium]